VLIQAVLIQVQTETTKEKKRGGDKITLGGVEGCEKAYAKKKPTKAGNECE
jgi:hypothetical protein